jgi:hypothetical protein
MNVTQKIAILKINVTSLIDHDDAPEEDVQAALNELKKYIDSQWANAKLRRKAKAEAKALPR